MFALFPRAKAFVAIGAAVALFAVLGKPTCQAACDPCTSFAPGISWGTVAISALPEASGIAASRKNTNVLWTHNDGSREKLFAIGFNGALLSTFNLNHKVDDVEDIAVGPGPTAGANYLYVGDIGGSAGKNNVRSNVQVLRIDEPLVDVAWAANPRSSNFQNVESFTLVYPDGSYDAETLMVDPLTGDLFIMTKEDTGARVYRANLNGVVAGSTVNLAFVRTLEFPLASGGDISGDGTQIIVRREDLARLWTRCNGESIDTALSRGGFSVPVIGTPVEPNGEGVAFLPGGIGYITISEGIDPALYFFQSLCPTRPVFTQLPVNQTGIALQGADFHSIAVGYRDPAYQWYFNTLLLTGETNASLLLTNLSLAQAGLYRVTASNSSGVVTGAATLTVRVKADLRFTEVEPSQATGTLSTADWWELTSYESQPVNLNGWKFNDNSGGLTDPYVITNLTIQPRELIVFVEGLTPDQFRTWWGSTNLPAGLKIVTYSGTGLGLGTSGDGLRLWNQLATNAADTVASVDFATATAGTSFNYDPVSQMFGALSVQGVNGVFKAAGSTDIGSPGRIMAPATSPLLIMRRDADQVSLEFSAAAGYRYTVQSRSSFAAGTWGTAALYNPTTNGVIRYSVASEGAMECFRVLVE
jgi:hypothetical protein